MIQHGHLMGGKKQRLCVMISPSVFDLLRFLWKPFEQGRPGPGSLVTNGNITGCYALLP